MENRKTPPFRCCSSGRGDSFSGRNAATKHHCRAKIEAMARTDDDSIRLNQCKTRVDNGRRSCVAHDSDECEPVSRLRKARCGGQAKVGNDHVQAVKFEV
jgi:hypothetical protein